MQYASLSVCACVFAVEVCRKKWKGLRDTYLNKKREGEKRSGSAGAILKKWRFSAVLSFLDPFTTPRETSGSVGQGVSAGKWRVPARSARPKAELARIPPSLVLPKPPTSVSLNLYLASTTARTIENVPL